MYMEVGCPGSVPGAAGGAGLALWPPLLALHACRLRRYLSDERRRCALCLAAFPSAWLLERHAALQHRPPAPSPIPTPPPPQEDKPFVCEQCGQSYRYRSAYVKHREQNHRARLPADKLFTCDVCGMQFRYLKSFKKHRLNHTLERLHTKSGTDPADRVSSSNEELNARKRRRHVEDESDSERESARKRESDREDSNGPKSSESVGVKSAEPPRPTASFASVSSLADSSESEPAASSSPAESAGILGFLRGEADRQRDRERRFACPFCGKCVRSKENLKLHVRKHTGERPFVCLFCGRAFGGKSDLTRHLRIHTGERPYHCEACGKCFARADYLSKHLTTHVHNSR